MPKPGAKPIADLTELRALAHPVRMRLLSTLYSRGEANVSELAEAVDAPVNQVSFHLRQLAKYDFIEPAPDRARDNRDRWWRPAYDGGIDWDRLLDTPIGAPAVRAHLTEGLEQSLAAVRTYFSSAMADLPEWPLGSFAHDLFLRVTPEEAAEFDREYLELCQRWQRRVRGRRRKAGRQDFAVFIYGFPQQDRA